jgi:hypothetical protein
VAGSLVDEGYLPESRAFLCPMEWAQVNHGWWTVLEPHFTGAYREQGTDAQKQASEQLKAEYKVFAKEMKKLRAGH